MARLTAGPGSSEPRKYVRHNKAIEGFPDTTVAMVISGGHFPGSDSEGFKKSIYSASASLKKLNSAR